MKLFVLIFILFLIFSGCDSKKEEMQSEISQLRSTVSFLLSENNDLKSKNNDLKSKNNELNNEIKLIKLFSNYIDKTLFRGVPVIKEKENGHTYKTSKNTTDPKQASQPIEAYSFISKNICLGTNTSQIKNIIKSYKP